MGVYYAKYGMSEAAVKAYWGGRRPASKVRAEHLEEAGIDLSVNEWRKLCRTGYIQPSEWHHTGAVGNETHFYDLNEPKLTDPEWIAAARAAIGKTKRQSTTFTYVNCTIHWADTDPDEHETVVMSPERRDECRIELPDGTWCRLGCSRRCRHGENVVCNDCQDYVTFDDSNNGLCLQKPDGGVKPEWFNPNQLPLFDYGAR